MSTWYTSFIYKLLLLQDDPEAVNRMAKERTQKIKAYHISSYDELPTMYTIISQNIL